MSEKQYEKETRSGNAVQRWLYAGLGALILVLGGAYLYRIDAAAWFLGTAEEVGDAQQAGEQSQEARETFLKTSDELGEQDESVAKLNIPTDSDGFFLPPADNEIPDDEFGESIRRGREIFLNPGANATEFVGNSLACANCHLNAGREANSAPMWAAAGMYPTYRGKNEMINTMEDRVNGCFTYSMNAPAGPAGGPPPSGHQIYKDLESYFHWLATGAPNRVDLPGSGFPVPDEPEAGYDPARGKKVFETQCAVCHGDEGEGRQDMNGRYAFPPLWGPDSYNWGAGMHRVNTAAGFIHANMPLGKPYSLSAQEAWDVAAYVNSHERPPDPRQPGEMSVAESAEQFHDHKGYYGREVGGRIIGKGVNADHANAPSATGIVVPEQ
ncbi:c-type cytochrome [Psychrobacter urativorans]|uniref:c-type cytochrome n=1 Tax=Psychrobacter urativorans TaxID=45610 RepID=UPI00191A21F4|nr:c-type cytochrome [Psychrobacter urativorans]